VIATAPASTHLSTGFRRVLVGAGALAFDAALGEPPARLHPVVGMGRMLACLRRRSRAETPAGQIAEGAMGLAAVVAASALGAAATARVLRRLPRGPALAGEAAALSTLLALRGLREAVAGVRQALDAGDLDGARGGASRDLVSRDTSELGPEELSGAAIQSLAENLSDSVVAPLLAYVAGGLPAAAAYRALNTADAMWGYRTP
jgi:adenosylcobinamide-phosphate synthase